MKIAGGRRTFTTARAALVVLMLLAAASAGAGGRVEMIDVTDATGMRVRVVGVIAFYGNEPHAFLGLFADPADNRNIASDRRKRIELSRETLFRLESTEDGPSPEALRALQSSPVVVTGRISEPAIGPGLPAVLTVEAVERRE